MPRPAILIRRCCLPPSRGFLTPRNRCLPPSKAACRHLPSTARAAASPTAAPAPMHVAPTNLPDCAASVPTTSPPATMPRRWHDRHAADHRPQGPLPPAAEARRSAQSMAYRYRLRRGETLGLVGESGCGKSTVSNATVGLIAPTSGSVRVLGTELAGADAKTLRAIRAHTQMVFQDPATSLNPRMTVGAAIGEPLLVRKLARGVALRTRVAELLEEVGLRPEHATRYPHQFSGGQRQRIVIARALALRPALLVCDEPVSALDVSVRAQIINLLVELQSRHGMSTLFVSHDLAVVRHVCDRVAVMYLGRLAELGPRRCALRTTPSPLHQGTARRRPRTRPRNAACQASRAAYRRNPEPRQPALGLPFPYPLPDRHRHLPPRGPRLAARR